MITGSQLRAKILLHKAKFQQDRLIMARSAYYFESFSLPFTIKKIHVLVYAFPTIPNAGEQGAFTDIEVPHICIDNLIS